MSEGTIAEGPDLIQTAYLANAGVVPKRVAEQLKMKARDVQDSVIGFPREEVGSVEVVAVGKDPDLVVKLADTTAVNLILEARSQSSTGTEEQRAEIMERLAALDLQITELDERISEEPADLAQLQAQLSSLTTVYSTTYEELARLEQKPATKADFVTLEPARALVITKYDYDDLRRQIRDGADYVTGRPVVTPTETEQSDVVEDVTGLPVVAEIPELSRKAQHDAEVVVATQPRSHVAEAYRVVRSAVLFAIGQKSRTDDGAIVLLVTSPSPSEGKTTTVANLAAVLAEGGLKVLVINCDFRRPRVHAYLLENGAAPADVGTAIDTGKTGIVHLAPTSLPGVKLVAGLGEGDNDVHPLEVIALQRKVVDLAKPLVDVILLDTAPFLATNDAGGLLDLADQVLLVFRSGRTKVEAAKRSAEVLERFDAPVLGVVFNASSVAPDAQYYYADPVNKTDDIGQRSLAN